MPEGVACNQGANLHPTRRFCQGRQHGPAFPDSPSRFTRITVEEVVRKPDTVETIGLRLLCNRVDRIIRPWPVVLALVRQDNHQPNLHGLLTRAFPHEICYL